MWNINQFLHIFVRLKRAVEALLSRLNETGRVFALLPHLSTPLKTWFRDLPNPYYLHHYHGHQRQREVYVGERRNAAANRFSQSTADLVGFFDWTANENAWFYGLSRHSNKSPAKLDRRQVRRLKLSTIWYQGLIIRISALHGSQLLSDGVHLEVLGRAECMMHVQGSTSVAICFSNLYSPPSHVEYSMVWLHREIEKRCVVRMLAPVEVALSGREIHT